MSKKIESQINELFEMAVESGEVTADSSPDDLNELFLNMVEMYLGDLSPEDLTSAREYFDDAFSKLTA